MIPDDSADDENSDIDTDSEQQTSTGAHKRPRTAASSSTTSYKKYTGAATYTSRYQASWHKKWPCKTRKDNPHAFECIICLRTMNCGHQGKKDVSRHIASVQH